MGSWIGSRGDQTGVRAQPSSLCTSREKGTISEPEIQIGDSLPQPSMTIIAERIFTPADQMNFAALSGDFNPMHVDEVAARRTVFGAPVVHGVHLLCWALESWIGTRGRPAAALEQVTARFNRGVLVGDDVQVAVLSDEEEFVLRVERNQVEMTSVRGRLGARVAYAETLPPMVPGPWRVMSSAEIGKALGSVPLAYAAADAKRLFPNLSAALPPFQLAAILASTRVVGMECPGFIHFIRDWI